MKNSLIALGRTNSGGMRDITRIYCDVSKDNDDDDNDNDDYLKTWTW
jgi:hypothetical protein